MTALLVASSVLVALTWIDWSIGGDTLLGVPYPLGVAAALVVNVAITAGSPTLKRRIVAAVQRRLLNPVVGVLVRLGVPLGWSLLETTGRSTGRRRVVPVGNGHEGDEFWIIAEHGLRAGYVRNIIADPLVRVRVRRGVRWVWRTGTAKVLVGDDPYVRQRWLIGWRHPLRALNAMFVRLLGTDPVTIRIDLDPLTSPPRRPASAVDAVAGEDEPIGARS